MNRPTEAFEPVGEMKRSWKRSGGSAMAAGGVFWAVAVLGGGLGFFGVGVGLLALGYWMVRPSRRAVLAEHIGDASGIAAESLTDSFAVTLEASEHDIRFFKMLVGETPIGLSGKYVRVGSEREWQVRVSTRQARVLCGREVLAGATRESRSSAGWVIDDGSGPFWLSSRNDRSVESARSATHLFGKDSTSAFRRHATLSRARNGPPTAELGLEYTVEAQLTRRFDADRRMVGEFSGRFEAHEPVPAAVAVLALTLTLGRWARRPPKPGKWTAIPPAGG